MPRQSARRICEFTHHYREQLCCEGNTGCGSGRYPLTRSGGFRSGIYWQLWKRYDSLVVWLIYLISLKDVSVNENMSTCSLIMLRESYRYCLYNFKWVLIINTLVVGFMLTLLDYHNNYKIAKNDNFVNQSRIILASNVVFHLFSLRHVVINMLIKIE